MEIVKSGNSPLDRPLVVPLVLVIWGEREHLWGLLEIQTVKVQNIPNSKNNIDFFIIPMSVVSAM